MLRFKASLSLRNCFSKNVISLFLILLLMNKYVPSFFSNVQKYSFVWGTSSFCHHAITMIEWLVILLHDWRWHGPWQFECNRNTVVIRSNDISFCSPLRKSCLNKYEHGYYDGQSHFHISG